MLRIQPSILIVSIAIALLIAMNAYNNQHGKSQETQPKTTDETLVYAEQTSVDGNDLKDFFNRIALLKQQEKNRLERLGFSRTAFLKQQERDKLDNLDSNRKALLKKQERDKLEKLDADLVALDIYVSGRMKQIEDWYLSEYERLHLWAEKHSKQLDQKAKIAYARCLQKMKNIKSNTVTIRSEDTYGYANTHYSPYGYAETSGYAHTGEVSQEIMEKKVIGDPVGDYKLELKSIEVKQREIEDVFSELIEKRNRYLAELETYAKGKRAVIESQKRLIRENTKVKLEGGLGVIEAISYSGEKPFIVLSGEILYEGDNANDFTIIKIHQDRVEFEKDGEVLVQSF